MKKNLLFAPLAIIMSCMVMGIMSCSDDDEPKNSAVEKLNVPWEEYDPNSIAILDSGSVTFAEICQNTIAHETGKNADMDSVLVSYAALMRDSVAAYEQYLKDSLISVTGANGLDKDAILDQVLALNWKKFTYMSVSATGEPIKLSGLFVYPHVNLGGKPMTGYYIGTHVTITSDEECPSNFTIDNIASDVGLISIFAHSLMNHGFVVMPDYEGYGITKNRPHPYLSREVTAKQVIDGAKAGMLLIDKLHELSDFYKLPTNFQTISVGYSQGGATSAATYRYALDHPEECASLHMRGAICGDGPYDPVATLNHYIKTGRMYMPVAVALMMKGMCDTDPEMIKEGCTVADFCTPGFINTGIFQALESKTMNTSVIQRLLLSYSLNHDDFTMMRRLSNGSGLSMDLPYKKANDDNYVKGFGWKWLDGPTDEWCEMDQALNEKCLAFLKDGTITDSKLRRKLRALLKCMRSNRLFHGEDGDWMPPRDAKFTFFHSTTDEVVPYVNMTSVREVWGNQKARYISFEYKPSLIENIVGDFKDRYSGPLYANWGTHGSCGAMFFIGKARGLAEDIVFGKWEAGAVNDDGIGALAFIAGMFKEF